MRIEYDDDALAILEKVNESLRPRGLEFVDDDKEHDGYCDYVLRDLARWGEIEGAFRKVCSTEDGALAIAREISRLWLELGERRFLEAMRSLGRPQ